VIVQGRREVGDPSGQRRMENGKKGGSRRARWWRRGCGRSHLSARIFSRTFRSRRGEGGRRGRSRVPHRAAGGWGDLEHVTDDRMQSRRLVHDGLQVVFTPRRPTRFFLPSRSLTGKVSYLFRSLVPTLPQDLYAGQDLSPRQRERVMGREGQVSEGRESRTWRSLTE
jgi:hypothetical protein